MGPRRTAACRHRRLAVLSHGKLRQLIPELVKQVGVEVCEARPVDARALVDDGTAVELPFIASFVGNNARRRSRPR
jgi:hypothetical protein